MRVLAKQSLWSTQRKPHYQKALKAAGKKLREYMELNKKVSESMVARYIDTPKQMDKVCRELEAKRANACGEIASRIAAAKRSNDDDTAPCEVLPTSEWSPTIGQPEAANSKECNELERLMQLAVTKSGPDYSTLRTILDAAFNHAATGKGKERHARDLPFDKQPMLETTRLVGPGFPLGQAIKKAGEAAGMISRQEYDAAEAECLGAINYLAGCVAWMRERKVALPVAAPTSVGAAA